MSFSTRALIFLTVFALHFQPLSAQTLEWARSAGGTDEGGGGGARDVAVDLAGNVYTTGNFSLDTDFDADGVPDVTDDGFGNIFVAKYSGEGVLKWVIAPGGEALDQGLALAVDAAGNVYVTGLVQGDADFNGDGSADVIVTGSDHVFLAKYDSDGVLQWVRSTCGRGEGVALDSVGNVFITGLAAFCADFDGNGRADITGFGPFVARYSQDGQFQWVRFSVASGGAVGSGIAVDDEGDVYIVGDMYGSADFSGDGNPDFVSNESGNVFLAKYNHSGTFQWVREAGAADQDAVGFDVEVSSTGGVFVTGYFSGNADFSGDGVPDVNTSGFGSAFIARYDAGGTLQWVRSLEGTFINEGHAIGVSDDAVYITGAFSSSVDLDGDGVGDADRMVFAKYDHAGVFQWVVSGGGPTQIDMSGLAVDRSDNVYISGYFGLAIDLDGDGVMDGISPRNSFELVVSKFSTMEVTAIEGDPTAEFAFDFVLEQNYPNPFNPVTSIRFSIPAREHVRLSVYNLVGQEVARLVDAQLDGSSHEVNWDASGMPTGLYTYTIMTGSFSETKAMVLLR